MWLPQNPTMTRHVHLCPSFVFVWFSQLKSKGRLDGARSSLTFARGKGFALVRPSSLATHARKSEFRFSPAESVWRLGDGQMAPVWAVLLLVFLECQTYTVVYIYDHILHLHRVRCRYMYIVYIYTIA